MANPGSSGLPHAIAVEGNGVDKDGADRAARRLLEGHRDAEARDVQFYCPIPGHKAAGMEGTLTVS